MPMPLATKIALGGLAAIALMGTTWSVTHDEGAASAQTTDDAYVLADSSTVAPRIAGQLMQVLVTDNERVRRGQLLATIDDRDYRVALASAEADQHAAEANAEGLRRQIARQDSVIAQAQAATEADAAAVMLSRANSGRYRDLAGDGSASRQEQQEADSRLASDQAASRRDMAGHVAAREQLPILRAQLGEAEAAISRAKAAVDAARLNLSYTQIRAPVDGVVGERTLRVGNYVQAGTPLLAVVPVRLAYVEARYRETQLARIRPGQPATFALDAAPGVTFKGHVESIAPASGASFAAIAPENATGNFTKITQRLAVRIAIDPNQPELDRLRVGMSVVPTVQTGG
ncbi:HlyD family secretion protein [Sphingomonas sp. QA11]|uniref:HlyD family secretion protein n=1 Tax=Sphingomonas sp. QA11 TaxID=2950605 RepID=UPI002349C278|nr:HlyD family secretion protein [Sphingomonas sp. QA11]WCM25985.1 HlyD family secretion protein [Sphingomonas sp. QA11]